MELSELVGEKTVELGGIPYKSAVLTLKDLGVLEQKLRNLVKVQGLANINDAKEYIDPSEIKDRYKKLEESLAQVYFGSKYFDALVMTPEGLSLIIYLSIRHNHPDITEDKINDTCTIKDIERLDGFLLDVFGIDPKKVEAPVQEVEQPSEKDQTGVV